MAKYTTLQVVIKTDQVVSEEQIMETLAPMLRTAGKLGTPLAWEISDRKRSMRDEQSTIDQLRYRINSLESNIYDLKDVLETWLP